MACQACASSLYVERVEKLRSLTSVAGGRAGTASTEGAELYNLKEDIGEKNNLAAKNPEKLKELCEMWDKWNAGNIPAAWGPGTGAPNGKRGQRKKNGAE